MLVSHGSLAEGLKQAAEMIMGSQEALAVLGLEPAQDMDKYRRDLEAAIRRVDQGRGVLVLADLFGGSPANTTAYMLGPTVDVVCGASLPMLLEVLGSRGELDLRGLASLAKEAGAASVVRLAEMLGHG